MPTNTTDTLKPEVSGPIEVIKADPPPAKTKGKADPTEALKATIAKLEAENALLRDKLPKDVTVKEGYKVVFIKSDNVAFTTTGNGAKMCIGSVNGDPFEVPCDRQVEVPDHVAEALKGVMANQLG